MKTAEKKVTKVTIREVAETLGWHYEDARAVAKRKRPADRYQTYCECEQKLMQAKQQLQEQFQNQ